MEPMDRMTQQMLLVSAGIKGLDEAYHKLQVYIQDLEAEIAVLERALGIATLTLPTPSASEARHWAKEEIANG